MKLAVLVLTLVLGLWTATPPVQAQGLQYGAPAAEEVAPPVLQPGVAPRILAHSWRPWSSIHRYPVT